MTLTQHVEACTTEGHLECTVIWADCDEDLHDGAGGMHPAGAVLWHSHMTSTVHPEHRIHPAHPALDHRGPGAPSPLAWSEPCADCRPHMPAGPAQPAE